MNAMILLAQGAMNMADSLATANPVLTEVNAPEMNMLDMAIKGGWIMIVLGVLSVVCFYILFERNYMIRKAEKKTRCLWNVSKTIFIVVRSKQPLTIAGR